MLESGMMTRSTDECEISRSCHSGTFSKAAIAFPRTRRARPESFSPVIGFRFVGIARRALPPRPEVPLDFENFGPLQVPELGRPAIDARGNQCQRRLVFGVPITLDDL